MPPADIGYFNPADDALRKRNVRRRVLKVSIIAVLALGLPIAAIATFLLTWNHRFEKNLANADAHIPVIKARLAGDPRFDELETIVHDSHFNGSIWISGLVRSQSDLDALHQIVNATSPPVAVYWRVTIATPAQIELPKQMQSATAPASQR